VSTSTAKNAHVLVATLSDGRSGFWQEPTRTDFDIRLHAYRDNSGRGGLEILFRTPLHQDRVFEALSALAMKAKLEAA
jgi:hypothetical protein